MSKVLVMRVGLAGAAESIRAVIDCGFALHTCVKEQGEPQMSLNTQTQHTTCQSQHL